MIKTLKRILKTLAFVLVFAFGFILGQTQKIPDKDDSCVQEVVDVAWSADHAWYADVVEEGCAYGMGVGWVIDSVKVGERGQIKPPTSFLTLETGGSVDEWPRIRWNGKRLLEVTIERGMKPIILTHQIGPILMDLRTKSAPHR